MQLYFVVCPSISFYFTHDKVRFKRFTPGFIIQDFLLLDELPSLRLYGASSTPLDKIQATKNRNSNK